MKLFADTANLEELENCLTRGFPSGVTTNPSILSKEQKRDFRLHIKDIIALLKKHLEAHPDSLAGHYALVAACERVGDLDGAREAFGWFVAEPQKLLEKWRDNPRAEIFDSAENLTVLGRALDRWAALTEAYRDDVNLHQTILNLFVAPLLYLRLGAGRVEHRLRAELPPIDGTTGDGSLRRLPGLVASGGRSTNASGIEQPW